MSSLVLRSKRARVTIAAAVASLVLLALPAIAEADWGAIAVDPFTGHYGVSYSFDSPHAAKHRARVECHTSHCQALVIVDNGWAAVVQKRNGIYFGGYGRTKHDAFSQARRRAHDGSAHRIAYVFSGY